MQAAAIPIALLGKDLCACATTGSGTVVDSLYFLIEVKQCVKSVIVDRWLPVKIL